MASALDTIAHVILPNLMKLKGASVVVSAMERRDVSLIGSMLRIAIPATDAAMTIAAGKAWAAHWAKTQPHRPQPRDPEQ